MRKRTLVFSVAAALVLTITHRLPAPIQEIPEGQSPTPTPDVSPSPTSSPGPALKSPATSWDQPHIYLQIADESQRSLATKLRERLQKSGYTVMGIQNVAGNEDIPTESSELRFFTPSDSAEAQRIAKEIAPFFGKSGILADLPEGMPYVSHARQYEIWFSPTFH